MNNRLPWISPLGAWLLLAPVPLMIIASFLAFVALTIGQAVNNGEPLWGFGNFYSAHALLDVLWWTALALTAIGILKVLSRYEDTRHAI